MMIQKGVVDYSGKISKEKLQEIIKSLNVTSGKTGIKGKIFITNASDQQKIEKVKSILKDLEKSSKKEIYLWANYVDEKQFTIDFTVGEGIENRENIIKNRAIFKKISVSDLSWGGDFNPLTAIFDGLSYLVSYLEIPPKFYDPTVEEYNPFLYEADKAMSQFTPNDILAKEVIKKSGIKTEKGVTPEHLTFAFKVGLWNGLVGTVKSIPELASLISKGIQLIYDEEFSNEFSNEYEKWKAKCDKDKDSDTYVGCAWDMLWEKIKQAHTTGSSPQIAQQYGKSTFDLITIPLTMVKAGKLGKINKIIDLLDPISNTMKIAGKTVKVTFNTTRRTFKYVINTAGKNFKRYELRFKIDGNTLYCGIPNGKISIIDKLKQVDIEKLPVDENGLRIADIDGEAIPIGNKNALEKIEGNGAPNAINITNNKQLFSLLEQLNNKEKIEKLVKSWSEPLQETLENDLLSKSTGGELRQLLKAEDDFLKWKLIKEDPAYAFEISKTDITWTKWGKSNFFKTITKIGKEFELAILNKVKTRIGKEYEALKKLVPDLDDRKLVEQMHFCLPGLTPPCNKQGEFFIADQVWIKYDEFDNIVDMVVVETKLSQSTGLSTGQTLAQQQAGKGSLFYKPTNAKKTDINDILLPKEIKQGPGIKLKDFYRLYGDGNKTFKGITK